MYIDSAAITQGSSLPKLIFLLLLFIELDKLFLGIYIICVIDCTVIKSTIIHETFIHGLKVFCVFSMCLLLCLF